MQEITNFNKAWVYTNRFKSAEGDLVESKSVCLVHPNVDFIKLFNKWNSYKGYDYKCEGTISIEEALALPVLNNHLSLSARLELAPDYLTHITYDYSLEIIG